MKMKKFTLRLNFCLLLLMVQQTLRTEANSAILQTCCPEKQSYDLELGICSEVLGIGEDMSQRKLDMFLENSNFSIIHPRYREEFLQLGTKLSLKYQPNSCENGNRTRLNFTKQMRLFPNGILSFETNNYYAQEYCLNKIQNGTSPIEILVCESYNETFKVAKCCDADQVWDLSLYPNGPIKCTTVSNGSWWSPKFHRNLQANQPLPSDKTGPIRILTNHPRYWCAENVMIYPLKHNTKFDPNKIFKILPDGSVWMKMGMNWLHFKEGTFCLDGAVNFRVGENSSEFSGQWEDTVLFDCGDHSLDVKSCDTGPVDEVAEGYAVSFIIASLFLFLTVAVYLLLWEKQNIHGWTSLLYFGSMFGMFVTTSLFRLSYLLFEADGASCFIVAIASHYFWLSTFCWMSCINFDLWLTFRTLLPTSGNRSKGFKRFMLYFLFSVGFPSGIVGMGVLFDKLYKNEMDKPVITPNYGKRFCFIDREFALLPYLYAPIAILLCCNLCFFTLVMIDMYKIKQSTKFASNSSSKNSRQKQSVLLFLKLFLLMGIPWIFEVISWATTPCGETTWYWRIFDYANIFQAVAIFTTFVCKTETLNSLETKFPRFKSFLSMFKISQEHSRDLEEKWPKLGWLWKRIVVRGNKHTGSAGGGYSSGKTNSTGVSSSKQSSDSSGQIKNVILTRGKDDLDK